MSYTELLLVILGRVCRWKETSRRVAEPAHPVVGRTNESQELEIADRAWVEILCGSAAERLVR
jgi:hypothetical protein